VGDEVGGSVWEGPLRGPDRGDHSAGGRASVRDRSSDFGEDAGRRRDRSWTRFVGIIDQILEEDGKRPGKQRHTSKRIFERLRDEHGYVGGLTIVKDYVLARRQRCLSRCGTTLDMHKRTLARRWNVSPALAPRPQPSWRIRAMMS